MNSLKFNFKTVSIVFIAFFLFLGFAFSQKANAAGGWVEKREITAVDDKGTARSNSWRNESSDGTAKILITPSNASDGATVTATNLPNGSTEVGAVATLNAYPTDSDISVTIPAKIATVTVPKEGAIYECASCFGFMGVSMDSLSLAGTGTPVIKVFYYKPK